MYVVSYEVGKQNSQAWVRATTPMTFFSVLYCELELLQVAASTNTILATKVQALIAFSLLIRKTSSAG